MTSHRTRKPRNLQRAGVIGGLTAAGLAAATMAFAAVVFTTSVTGEATIKDVAGTQPTTTTTVPPTTTTTDPAKPKVAVSVSGSNTGNLDCRQVGVSGDYKTLTFKPVLTRTQGETAKAETCTVTLKVRNTGNTLIHLDGQASQLAGPDGWTASAPSGDAVTAEIKPAEVKTAAITITATPEAKAGAFTGQLVWADNS